MVLILYVISTSYLNVNYVNYVLACTHFDKKISRFCKKSSTNTLQLLFVAHLLNWNLLLMIYMKLTLIYFLIFFYGV